MLATAVAMTHPATNIADLTHIAPPRLISDVIGISCYRFSSVVVDRTNCISASAGRAIIRMKRAMIIIVGGIIFEYVFLFASHTFIYRMYET